MMKQKMKDYLYEHSFERYLELTGDDHEHLTTVMNHAFDDVNWKDPKIIPTAFNQLKKAIDHTTDHLKATRSITHEEYEAWKKEIHNVFTTKCPDQSQYTEYKTISDMAVLCNYAASDHSISNGYPIGIGKGILKGGKYQDGKEVYIALLTGTEIEEGQSYGIVTDILAGIETNSVYLESTLKSILEYVPLGSDLILLGFSLGGMMVQQIMVQPCIYENYNLLQCTILASPALCVDERNEAFRKRIAKDCIHRIICYYDIIPFLSVDYFLKKDYLEGQVPKEGTVYETLHIEYANNYKTAFFGTHLIGYIKDKEFKHYDVLGYDMNETEAHSLLIKMEDFHYLPSPAIAIGPFGAIE